jgi:hypothetical protein
MAQYVTDFLHHGKNCRRVLVEPKREFVVGVDLGQMADNTTVAIVQYMSMGTGEFDVHEGRNGMTIIEEKYQESYDLRELQKIKLETSYDQVIDHINVLMHTPPLTQADLVFDSTAGGLIFGDLLEARTNLDPIRVVSTAGNETIRHGHRKYSVPKTELVSTLSGLFASNMVRVAHDLPNLETLRREVQTFLLGHSATGRPTYSASAGNHDDLISALALACWWASMRYSPAWVRRRGGEFSQGFVKGMI